MEQCDTHTQLVSDIAVIKSDLVYIKDRVCNHITQGEERGGFRDRLVIVEQDIAALKKAKWLTAVTAGLIGGLVSQLTPEVAQWIIKMLVH
jgi:hypothetical protein